MAKPAEIQVEGMKEVRKALRTFSTDNGWRAPLKDAYGDVARLVEIEAQTRARRGATTLAGTSASMGGRAAGSIKGKGTTTGASLQGGKGIAYFAGWNFGSKGAFRQFPAKATPDYAMYAAVADKREQIMNEFAESVGDALDREF